MRRNLFRQRVMNLWKSLPQKAGEAGSLSVFKTEIDRFSIGKEIKGYVRMGLRNMSAMMEW